MSWASMRLVCAAHAEKSAETPSTSGKATHSAAVLPVPPVTPAETGIPNPPYLTEQFPAGWLNAAKSDPVAAARNLTQLEGDLQENQRMAAKALAHLVPGAVLPFLEACVPDPKARKAVLKEALGFALNREFASTLKTLAALPTEQVIPLIEDLLNAPPITEIETLRSWYEQLPAGGLKNEVVIPLLTVLTPRDAGAAFNLLGSLPPGFKTNRGGSRGSLLTYLVDRVSPAEATLQMARVEKEFPDLGKKLAETKANRKLLNALNLRKEDLPEALAGVPPDLRKRSATEAYVSWAKSDPKRAAATMQAGPAASQIPEVYKSFVKTWANLNVTDSSAWVSQLAPGPTKVAAVEGLIEGLKTDYPVEALTWLETLEGTLQAKLMKDLVQSCAVEYREEFHNACQKSKLAPLLAPLLNNANN